MTTPTPNEVARARYIATAAGADEALDAAIRTDRRGRRRIVSGEMFLVGVLLTIQRTRQVVLSEVYETLTMHLPLADMVQLGIYASVDARKPSLKEEHLRSFARAIRKKLDRTRHGDLSDAEQRQRRDLLQEVLDRLLLPTLEAAPPRSSYALDGSAIYAHARGKSKRQQEADHDEELDGAAESAVASASSEAGGSWDPDADWGYKTPTPSAPQPTFFGYMLHALTGLAEVGHSRLPGLAERITLTGASQDVVAPSLYLIDRLRDSGASIKDLAVDRDYSNKRFDSWGLELRRRGINQHLDLRSDDQGFADYDGAKVVAGALHCPATPDHLADIPAPNIAESKKDKKAWTEAWAKFHARIDERRQYAFDRRGGPYHDGTMRLECPARAGKVGCRLVPGSVEAARHAGLPVVHNPPAAEDDIRWCHTQRPKTSVPDLANTDEKKLAKDPRYRLAKLAQKYYWGSREWRRSYMRRTVVEQLFGNLKNRSTENLSRGFVRGTGLGQHSIYVACAVALANTRLLRNWHSENGVGDSTHPLLAKDPRVIRYEVVLDDPEAAAA